MTTSRWSFQLTNGEPAEERPVDFEAWLALVNKDTEQLADEAHDMLGSKDLREVEEVSHG